MPAALLAALFLAAAHELQHWLWSDPEWYLVLGLPVAGACVVPAAVLAAAAAWLTMQALERRSDTASTAAAR